MVSFRKALITYAPVLFLNTAASTVQVNYYADLNCDSYLGTFDVSSGNSAHKWLGQYANSFIFVKGDKEAACGPGYPGGVLIDHQVFYFTTVESESKCNNDVPASDYIGPLGCGTGFGCQTLNAGSICAVSSFANAS